MRKPLLLLMILLFPAFAEAQTTSVTLQVTDVGGQSWNNGTWSVLLVSQPGATTPGPPFNLVGGGTVPNQSQNGSLNSTGGASMTLTPTVSITPTQSQWKFTVCPAQGILFPCFTQSTTISGASQTVTITPTAISVSCGANISAYTDGEVSCNVGGQYYNLTLVSQRQCTTSNGTVCSVWTAGGSSVSPNTPIPQSQVGPGFNVRNYGAKGDTQTSNVGVTNGTTTVTCANCAFTQADVGKTIFAHTPVSVEAFNSLTTIASVTNATTIVTSQAAGTSASGQTLIWGHLDDTAISVAVTAFNAAIKGVAGNGSLGVMTASPVLYFPAGNYLLCSTLNGSAIAVANFSQLDGWAVVGDGPDQSIVTAGSGAGCPVQNNNAGMLLDSRSGNGYIRDITFDGAYNVGTAGAAAVFLAGAATHLERVNIQRWNPQQNIGALVSSGGIYMNVVIVLNNGKGFVCTACNGEIYESIFTNNQNNPNLTIANVIGLNFGNGLHIINSIVDECGSQVNGCVQITKSSDVWLNGGAYFSTNSGQSINVDGQSFVHLNSGIVGVFGADSNSTGLFVQTGGVVQASDVRFVSTGTGKCINNNGRFQDNGANTCENMFQIASGTSTGTIAVLTLTNVGAAVNTNCSVGDALMVQGAGITGYNGYYPAGATSGITATSATTLTYTTAGSNLGAAGAGGTAYCRNLQTFTGNLPVALLNNPIPNTCYYTITPIANATAVTLCNFSTGTATNITRIRASSQVVTTCATAPIITISDGTATQTLTLTSAKSSWDSAVDASSGVGTTIFKPNGTITVKYDVAAASACATPPTNLAVSYNISPILSN